MLGLRYLLCVQAKSYFKHGNFLQTLNIAPLIQINEIKKSFPSFEFCSILTVQSGSNSEMIKGICKKAEEIRPMVAITKLDECWVGAEEFSALATKLSEARDVLFLGRGLLYPLALEGALKLKEISYIHAEAYPAGEMKHGVNALIGKDMPSLIMAPSGKSFNKMVSTVNEIKARDGEVIGILDVKNNEMNLLLSNYLIIDSFNYYLDTVLYTISLQLLSFYTSLILKINPDRPRNLAKTVTVE